MSKRVTTKQAVAAYRAIMALDVHGARILLCKLLDTKPAAAIHLLESQGVEMPSSQLCKVVVLEYRNFISLIKLIRELTGLGLKDAKAVWDSKLPSGQPVFARLQDGSLSSSTVAPECWPLPGVIAQGLSPRHAQELAQDVARRLAVFSPDVKVASIGQEESYRLPEPNE